MERVRWTEARERRVQSTSDLAIEVRIDGLQFDGCTNITLGAYWGGVILDPTGRSQGGELGRPEKDHAPHVRRHEHDRSVDLDPGRGDCARKASMDAGTIDTCGAIKARGIEIYSVNVVNGDPTVLRACASGPNHYFYADSAAKIAKKLENVTDEIKRRAIVRLAS